MPGGALRLMEAGALDDVVRIFMLHCDPTVDVGQLGLREGPLTGAADALDVRLTGRGGHTSRPHLTEDLTFALGKVLTELPAILSRRLDPRAGVSLVWGSVRAGSAHNVIPGAGQVAGTVRMLDAVAWARPSRSSAADRPDRPPYGVTRASTTSAAYRPWSTRAGRRTYRRGHRAGRSAATAGHDHPEPGRRGLRLVSRPRTRGDGPPRHPYAGRSDVRPPPGRPARRRAGGRVGSRVLAEPAVGRASVAGEKQPAKQSPRASRTADPRRALG